MTKSEIKVGEVPVCVTRKGIKHMHLYVQPPYGRVVASVPEDASDESIQFFVRENFGWILREREAMRGQARQTPREYVSGETLYVWGEQKFLTVEKQKGWGGVKISGNEITLLAPEESTVKSRREYMTDWYRRLLTDAVNRLLPKWEKKTGLCAERFEIRDMARSWGTCNQEKGKIQLNLQLSRKPREALEYVILHELCHFKCRNHGKEFVSLLDRYMPSWREVRQRLNDAPLDFVGEDEMGSKGP